METMVDKELDPETLGDLRAISETVTSLHEEFVQLEARLRETLPHFKEWTIRKFDLKPVWWDFEELFKADYLGTDHEVYEVIVSPEGRLRVTRL